jgi:hypothetical protein
VIRRSRAATIASAGGERVLVFFDLFFSRRMSRGKAHAGFQ